MKENFKKLRKIVYILCISVFFVNCSTEESASKQGLGQSVNIETARKWFDNYKSTKEFNSIFKNQVYDWSNSKIEILENDSKAIVVPVFDKNQDENYKGKKFLYFYPSKGEDAFKTTLYELLPTDKSLEEQNLTKALSNFDGFVVKWDLEKGFVESAKFEKSVITAVIIGQEISPSKPKDMFSKAAAEPNPIGASYCLGDLILCNDYKNSGGYSGAGYVYYVNAPSGSGGGYAGDYFNYYGGGSGGGGASSASSASNSTALLEASINSTNENAHDFSIVQTGDTVVAKALIGLLPWANLQIDITQYKVGDKFVVDNVASNPVGLTIGYGWAQSSFSKTTIGDTTTVICNGIASYTLFVEGIGTISTSSVSYSITVNNRTGQIISGKRLSK